MHSYFWNYYLTGISLKVIYLINFDCVIKLFFSLICTLYIQAYCTPHQISLFQLSHSLQEKKDTEKYPKRSISI